MRFPASILALMCFWLSRFWSLVESASTSAAAGSETNMATAMSGFQKHRPTKAMAGRTSPPTICGT